MVSPKVPLYLRKACKNALASKCARHHLAYSKKGRQIKEELKSIYQNSDFSSDAERIYAAAKDLACRPTCATCGKPTKLYSISAGFSKFCSRACSWKSVDTLQKRKNNNLKKYGVESHTKLDTWKVENSKRMRANSSNIQKKRKHALTEKFGDIENAYKIIWKKARDTLFNKHGVSNIAQLHNSPASAGIRKAYIKKLPNIISQLEKELNVKALWDPQDYYKLQEDQAFRWRHVCGHHFTASFNSCGRLPVCPACSPKSKPQQLLQMALISRGINVIINDRKLIFPKEIDILLPDFNIGIEVNGIYWHAAERGRLSLLEKSQLAESAGISLLHFWDWEIETKLEKVMRIIEMKMGKFERRIYARQLQVKTIDRASAKEFLDCNHFDGFAGGRLFLGLMKDNELLAVASFSRTRFSSGNAIEITRLATVNNTQIIGGISRLAQAAAQYFPGKRLISYVNCRFFNGAGYEAAGFKFVSRNAPNYWYFKGTKIINRLAAQKHKLPKLLGKQFNVKLSERENMLAAGWQSFYDCGTMTWEKVL